MKFSKGGNIAAKFWNEIPDHFNNVELDEHVIMPNHLYGIMWIKNVEKRHAVSLQGYTNRFGPLKKKSLPTIIGSYKSAVKRYFMKVNPNFAWPPGFYNRVIRDDYALERIRNYILNNPEKWDENKDVSEEDKSFIKALVENSKKQ